MSDLRMPPQQPDGAEPARAPADTPSADNVLSAVAPSDATPATQLAGRPAPPPAGAATQVAAPGAAPTRIMDAPTAATRVEGDATAPTRTPGHPTGATEPAGDPGAALEALVGSTLGGCRIEKLLGRGGMGAVFRAQQLSLGRAVALKVMLPGRGDDPQFAERFVREARVVATLNHPNVVQVFDAGRDAATGMLYMLMEYVEGRTLGQVIKAQGALAVPLALEVIRQAAEGLAAAHGQRLVHRDIKPDNLMIDRACRVKVMDFGLARGGGGGDSALTQSGMILGTPNYISPEAARGAQADIRGDLYSLGVTLWQAVAGRLPFSAPTPVQVMVQHLESPPPDLVQAAGCPMIVGALTARLLAKDASQRPADPASLVAAIDDIERELCGGPVRLRWDGERLATTSQLRDGIGEPPRSRAGILVAAGLAAATGAGLWYWLGGRDGGTTSPAAAAHGIATADRPPTDLPAPTGGPPPAGDQPADPALPAVGDPSPALGGRSAAPSPAAPPPVVTPASAVVHAPAQPPPASVVQASVPPANVADITPPAPASPLPGPTPLPPTPPPPTSAGPVAAAPSPASPVPPSDPAAAPPLAPPVRVVAPDAPPAHLLAPATGLLAVSSLPAGATVWLDGAERGTTPLLLRDVAAGTHLLRLALPGEFDQTQTIVVAGGTTTRVRNPLQPPARLELQGLPAGAIAVVAGVPYRAGMLVPTGEIGLVVLGAAGEQRFPLAVKPGPNVFSLAPPR